jgi:HAMP domain-containing protein
LDAPIEINRKDEIGELAEAVSRMQASLQAAIERLRARRTGT